MLEIKPISFRQANDYVEKNHRHHPRVQGCKYTLACYDDDRLCGVAIVGHPQGRFLDDGETVEVLRLCTDGTYNACSMLYGRCSKVAKDMGYHKIITFILASELGTSLKASGWKCENEKCGGKEWNYNSRQQKPFEQLSLIQEEKKEVPKEYKQRWVKDLTI